MSEFIDIDVAEDERKGRRFVWVGGVLLGVVGVALFVGLTSTPTWEEEYRAYIQEGLIDEPDFFETCGAMHMFGLTGDKIAAMALAQGGPLMEENPERAERAAHIAGDMIGEACGL